MTRSWCAAGAMATFALIGPRTSVQTQQGVTASPDLATLFTPGGILQDRNGDGVIDFVNARFVLGERPSAEDVCAAADVAARLGFETMAMNLPLSSTPEPGAAAFIIGRDGARRAGLTPPALAALKPGDGIVMTAMDRGTPAILVAGADAAGTMAAAELVAARLPHVWDPEGPSLTQVAADVRRVLTGAGTVVATVAVPAVSVRADAGEIRAIDVTVNVPTAAAASGAATTLRRLIAPSPTRPSGASPAAPTRP